MTDRIVRERSGGMIEVFFKLMPVEDVLLLLSLVPK